MTPWGLTTGLVPDNERAVSLDLDLCEHRFVARADGGAVQGFALEPMSVADFFGRAKAAIAAVGGIPTLHPAPSELPHPVPFAEDTVRRPYDRAAVERFHRALLSIEGVLSRFRTSYLGKVSPVHLFWGRSTSPSPGSRGGARRRIPAASRTCPTP